MYVVVVEHETSRGPAATAIFVTDNKDEAIAVACAATESRTSHFSFSDEQGAIVFSLTPGKRYKKDDFKFSSGVDVVPRGFPIVFTMTFRRPPGRKKFDRIPRHWEPGDHID